MHGFYFIRSSNLSGFHGRAESIGVNIVILHQLECWEHLPERQEIVTPLHSCPHDPDHLCVPHGQVFGSHG